MQVYLFAVSQVLTLTLLSDFFKRKKKSFCFENASNLIHELFNYILVMDTSFMDMKTHVPNLMHFQDEIVHLFFHLKDAF